MTKDEIQWVTEKMSAMGVKVVDVTRHKDNSVSFRVRRIRLRSSKT